MLCVQLRDIRGDQLRALGRECVNGLAAIATRLFLGDQRRHLAGISFVSLARTTTQRRQIEANLSRTSYQDVGSVYVFANPSNPAANEIDSIFR